MRIPEIFLHVVAAALLGGGVYLAYRWLVGPYAHGLTFQQQGAVLLVLLAMVGGFVGAFFWWADEPRSFAWDLPPLASRMLAAAGWSFTVAGVLALHRPTFQRLRLVMLMLFIYLAPLAAVIFLLHLNRFNPGTVITYTFFLTAITMTAGSLWYLIRPQRITRESAPDLLPSPPLLQAWMAFVALITGIWGLSLFFTDKGPSALIWVWPGDLLSSQLIGVMLLTIAAGSLYSLRRASLSRMMLLITMIYSLGLALASLWNGLTGKPVKESYLVVFGIIFLISMFLLPLLRQPRRQVIQA